MKIAELFVNLGVKGAEKTMGALTGVKKGLGETAESGLAAKAALVGAFYALERMMSASGKRGTDLTNFNAELGVSAKTLQQYQYAARQVGVSNEAVAGTFKTLQSTMTKTLMGEGAPKGLARLAQLTGNITARDIEEYAKAPEKLLQRLQEYAGKETNIGFRNEVLKSFGLGDDMIAALSRKAFRPEVLAKAPTLNEGETSNLDKVRAGWANLGATVDMAFDRFNAKHGGQLIGELTKIVPEVLKLVDAFTKLSEKAHLFELMGKAFEGWAKIFQEATAAINGFMKVAEGLFSKDPKKQAEAEGALKEWSKDTLGTVSEMGKAAGESINNTFDGVLDFAKKGLGIASDDDDEKPVPTKPAKPANPGQVKSEKAVDVFKTAPLPVTAGEAPPLPSLQSPAVPLVPGSPFAEKPAPEPTGLKPPSPAALAPATPPKLQLVPAPSAAASPRAALPRPPAVPTGAPGQAPITVNQTLQFEGDISPKEAGDHVEKAVQKAFRQYGAQAQGS